MVRPDEQIKHSSILSAEIFVLNNAVPRLFDYLII